MSTASAPTAYPHISHDSKGVPIIAGTTMKVVELVMAQRAHGWSPEELAFQFPHISMSQIHAALTYYWDHRDELDADIDRREQFSKEAREAVADSPLAQRLASLKSHR